MSRLTEKIGRLSISKDAKAWRDYKRKNLEILQRDLAEIRHETQIRPRNLGGFLNIRGTCFM